MSAIDAAQHLNRLLAGKPKIKVQKSRSVTTQECRVVRPSVRSGGEDYISCRDVTTTESYEDIAQALVASTEVKAVNNLTIHTGSVVSLPESVLLVRKDIVNLGDATITSGQTLSVSGTRGWTFTKSRSVTTTLGTSRTLSVGIPGVGSMNVGLSWSQAVSVSNSATESHSETVTRSTSETITVGPRRCVSYELLAYQIAVEVRITADLVIDGSIVTNSSGITLASQLLSVEERTVPFEAILRIEDVSHGIIRTRDIGGANGQDTNNPIRIHETGHVFQGKPGDYLVGFTTQSKLQRSGATALMSTQWSDGPVIVPPDGIHYEVLYTTQVHKPAFECGFNDVGLLNSGTFDVEVRQYSEYAQGSLLRQWTESVETFVACIPV